MKLPSTAMLAAGLLAVLPTAAPAQPHQYTIQALPCLENDLITSFSNATGLNELGYVAGIAENDLTQSRSVIWYDGQIHTELPYQEGDLSFEWAKGINIHNQVVGQGTQYGEIPVPHWLGVPMTWTAATGLSNPDPNPTPRNGWAWGINDAGQIAISVNGAMGVVDPVNGLREFGFPSGTGNQVWEINNNGVVCGSARPAPGEDISAYRYDYTTDTIVDLTNGPQYRNSSDAYGLNDNGDIVGWSFITASFSHAMIWAADGRDIMLPIGDLDPNYLDDSAEHINNLGDVVGWVTGPPGSPRIGWIGYDMLSVGPADVTTQGAGVGDPGYGVPDRQITAADLNYFVNAWVAGDTGIADVTTQGAGAGDPGYGLPDGLITAADLNYFINDWVAGPTLNPKHRLTDLLSPADAALWSRMQPFEINDAGQICGTGSYNGTTRGFLMTPVTSN